MVLAGFVKPLLEAEAGFWGNPGQEWCSQWDVMVWAVRLSWKRGSEWDQKLNFGAGRREGLGLQAQL